MLLRHTLAAFHFSYKQWEVKQTKNLPYNSMLIPSTKFVYNPMSSFWACLFGWYFFTQNACERYSFDVRSFLVLFKAWLKKTTKNPLTPDSNLNHAPAKYMWEALSSKQTCSVGSGVETCQWWTAKLPIPLTDSLLYKE